MDLILWRHAEAAEAEGGEDDLERALTAKGQKQARRMGEWLSSQLPDSCRILVSPAVRTRETAEGLQRKFKIVQELAPGADAEDVLLAANWPNSKEPVLVVGHQPTLGQVAALVMTGQPQDWQVKKASAWWIVRRDALDPYSVYLKAVLGPDQILK
ncbi:MAG: phosphohistidine phosphatase SixA [Gammaproteobacteria bacterium]